jgi:TRAP-type C4-dicarboxylate transport system permease small subunit
VSEGDWLAGQRGVDGDPRDWVRRGDAAALWMGRVELAIAAVLIGASLGISLYTIVTRALLIPTSEWVLDLPLEFLTLASLFGAGALIANEGHIGVDFVVDRLPPRPRALTRGVVNAFLGAVCLFLVAKGVTVTRQAVAIQLTIPEIFDLPVAIPTGAATAALCLWALHFGWLAVRHCGRSLDKQAPSALDERA